MKVTAIGTGYVGLVTGACLAEMGNHVVCLDVDAEKIRVLNDGGIPIHEPGLQEVVRRNVAAGRLQFTTDVDHAVQHGTLLFVGVGTPPDEDGSADLQYVVAAARAIGQRMTDYKVIVDKSTVPVGTADRVRAAIQQELDERGRGDMPYAVVSNPEFLKEGAAVEDFMKPDRIIVGSDDEQATLLMRAIYAPFNRTQDRMLVMDVRSAEFTKYAANAMLATRISFMNELALLAEKLGADIELVRRGIGSEPDTDDMREAPSLVVLDELTRRGATVLAYDPVSMPEAARVLGPRDDVRLVRRAEEALQGADALLVLTEWKEFRTPDFDAIKAALKQPVILDGRNLYDPRLMKTLGFSYSGIGRG